MVLRVIVFITNGTEGDDDSDDYGNNTDDDGSSTNNSNNSFNPTSSAGSMGIFSLS